MKEKEFTKKEIEDICRSWVGELCYKEETSYGCDDIAFKGMAGELYDYMVKYKNEF